MSGFDFGALAPHGMQFDMPKPSGGMFASGGKFGIGQAIVAALNGYLASQPGSAGEVGRNNMQMMAAMKQRQMERQQELDDYNRKRGDDNADFISQYQYKIDHPAPTSNDTVNDYQFIARELGDDAAKQFLKIKTNPIVVTPYGPMPYSSVAEPQVPKVGDILDDPRTQGGPALQAPGGFRY